MTSARLTWLTGTLPLSEFDSLSRQLWKLLANSEPKEVFTPQPYESRALLDGDGPAVWRYAYVDAFSQVLLLQERMDDGELLRELFCVPTGPEIIVGARLPLADAEQTRVLVATAGTAQELEPTDSWPDIKELRTVVGDAAAEEQLDSAPVASLTAERDYLAAQLASANEALRHSRFEVQSLKHQLSETGSELPTLAETEGYPETLAELGTWAQQYAERMLLAERAIRGAKKSLYRDPEMVYRCLEHLATRYWELKTGKISVAAHDAALAAMPGVSLRGSAGVTVAGEHGETYFISHKGRRIFLDLHLAKGGGMDQRYCMRIYFTWLPEEQRVLVGDLPAHLANSLA